MDDIWDFGMVFSLGFLIVVEIYIDGEEGIGNQWI